MDNERFNPLCVDNIKRIYTDEIKKVLFSWGWDDATVGYMDLLKAIDKANIRIRSGNI